MAAGLSKYATAVVAAHALFTGLHGAAHAGANVPMSPLANVFIGVVIVAAPLVAAALLRTRARRAGAWLLLLSMAGSLVFGVVNHFVVAGPDHVSHVGGAGVWRPAFVATAVLIALVEFAGSALGLWAVAATRRENSAR
jgi:hypothetical protein